MRRIKKLTEAKMFSARIEKDKHDELKKRLETQKFLTIQDFMAYSVKLLLDDSIIIQNNEFVINPEMYRKIE